ncbi:uncharacterized protein PpBr36_06689 [Pyricularia pennisetigena]|uniref:uncharacterized protein n=1 Tax=Pyricularia pennisetigena TaxID=1578925 RepID=UPI00114F95BB|nr:uncharacterized protein PpBr36_06689 [Pyricularia pennisetigena]TLS23538.1 hypothetical protein PpBr36_06689 [Pyricularia pennisetigena]
MPLLHFFKGKVVTYIIDVALLVVQDEHVEAGQGSLERPRTRVWLLKLGPFLDGNAPVDAAQRRVCVVPPSQYIFYRLVDVALLQENILGIVAQ